MMMNKAQERRERITSEHEGVKYRRGEEESGKRRSDNAN